MHTPSLLALVLQPVVLRIEQLSPHLSVFLHQDELAIVSSHKNVLDEVVPSVIEILSSLRLSVDMDLSHLTASDSLVWMGYDFHLPHSI